MKATKKERARNVKYYKDNKDYENKRCREYNIKNRTKITARRNFNKAKALGCVPVWITSEHKNQILMFYIEAARLTKQTGEKYTVDHIIPLKAKQAKGLHVPWNLQVITQSENSKKHNNIPEEYL